MYAANSEFACKDHVLWHCLYSTIRHWLSSITKNPNRKRKTRLVAVYFNVLMISNKPTDIKMVEYFRIRQLLLCVHLHCTHLYAIYHIVSVYNWSFCIRNISQFYHDTVACICDLYLYDYTCVFLILLCNRALWKNSLSVNIFEKNDGPLRTSDSALKWMLNTSRWVFHKRMIKSCQITNESCLTITLWALHFQMALTTKFYTRWCQIC